LANKFFIALVFFNKSFFILSTVPYSVTFDSIVALKLSSAIYYLIESDGNYNNVYDSSKYYNLCLTYMDSFFRDYINLYMKSGYKVLWTKHALNE